MQTPVRFVVFFLVMALVDGLAHWYFHKRLTAPVQQKRLRHAAAFIAVALALLFPAAPIAWRLGPGAAAVSRAGYVWWAAAFYLVLFLGAFDLARMGWRLFRASRALPAGAPARDGRPAETPADPARRVFLVQSAGAVAATAAVTAFGMRSAFGPPRVSETAVRLPRLARALDGLVVAHLTDIHAGAWIDRRFVAELVERTNALRPDLVVVTGDVVDGSVRDLADTVEPLGRLRARFGVWGALGNHEYYSGVGEWSEHLPRLGVQLLRNRLASPVPGLDLAGVDDWAARRHGYDGGWDLGAALRTRNPDHATLLLAHQPNGFEQAAAAGVGLQLSGHTHGGQMWPWTLAVRAAYHPYLAGLSQLGESALYVSRGCGFWGPPVRVAAPSEIAKVVLLAA